MAKKTKQNNKGLLAGICAGVAVVIIAIIIVLVVNKNSKLDDSFFVSDGTKYVVSMDANDSILNFSFNEYLPETVHLAYFYSGDKITDVKAYFEYKDENTAKKAADYIAAQEINDIKTVEANGKYVVITTDKSQYEGMTATDAKQQVELLEMLTSYEDEEEIVVDETDDNENSDTDIEETE